MQQEKEIQQIYHNQNVGIQDYLKLSMEEYLEAPSTLSASLPLGTLALLCWFCACLARRPEPESSSSLERTDIMSHATQIHRITSEHNSTLEYLIKGITNL
jgi:hypothetical protein